MLNNNLLWCTVLCCTVHHCTAHYNKRVSSNIYYSAVRFSIVLHCSELYTALFYCTSTIQKNKYVQHHSPIPLYAAIFKSFVPFFHRLYFGFMKPLNLYEQHRHTHTHKHAYTYTHTHIHIHIHTVISSFSMIIVMQYISCIISFLHFH